MKLKENFILQEIGDETFLVPIGKSSFSGLARGNKTLGVILGLLQSETDEQKIVAAMCAQFDAPKETIERDVRRTIEQLRSIDAIEE